MKLTARQKRFCEEYLICLNATEAAIKAGYSEKTAKVIGYENLTKPYIADYIAEKQKELSEKTGVTAQMVIKELAKIGFANIQDYIEPDNKAKDFTTIGNDKAAAIASVKVTEVIGENFTRTSTEFKLHDKQKSLEMLGRHLGIFEKDNTQGAEGFVKLLQIVPASLKKRAGKGNNAQ